MRFHDYEVAETPLSRRIATSLERMKKLEAKISGAGPGRRKALWRRIRAIQVRTDVFIKKVTGASWH